MPKVTVLMAVYNGERYLQEAIDSILAQTYHDFEFLIINDGSSDSTWEILNSYKDPRIRLLNNDSNLGLTRSLNKGLKLAEGELIARQDGDDISEPERLAKQVAFLETHPEVALVGTQYKEIDSEGQLIRECNLPYDSTQIRWDILFYCPFVHSAVMFRRATITEHIGFYNEDFLYAQDYDLWWRIVRCFPSANINEYLMKLRINPSSMTVTYGNIVDDEPLQIKITNIGYILGWEQAQTWNEKLIGAITLLWSGSPQELKVLSQQEINKNLEEIFKFYHAFCQYYKLDSAESKNKYLQVCYNLGEQLFNLADNSLYQDSYNAWQLLFFVFHLNFRILLTSKGLLFLFKLLLGSRILKMIRDIRKKQKKTNLSQAA